MPFQDRKENNKIIENYLNIGNGYSDFIAVLKTKNYDIDIKCIQGTSLFLNLVEGSENRALKIILKNPDLNWEMENLPDIIFHLAFDVKQYRFLRYILKRNKEIIKEKYLEQIELTYQKINEIELKHYNKFDTLENYLLFLSIIKEQFLEKDIKKYKKVLNKKGLEIEKLNQYINLNNQINKF